MKTAVIAAKGLGDGLLSMILAHNLFNSNIPVTCFSSILCELKSWFPHHDIRPFPAPQNYKTVFSAFDRLVIADHACLNEKQTFAKQALVLKEKDFNRHRAMVDNLVFVCKNHLHLEQATSDNGLRPPQSLIRCKYPKRVIIHPTSTSNQKNWPAQHYIKLCLKLKRYGFDPVICVAAYEHALWQEILKDIPLSLPLFTHLEKLASFIFESGSFIGNDSGLGHLACCLKLPTLSLFARKSAARLWRPGWGNNCIVTPLPLLLGARLKEKYWKQLLLPHQVASRFLRHHSKQACF